MSSAGGGSGGGSGGGDGVGGGSGSGSSQPRSEPLQPTAPTPPRGARAPPPPPLSSPGAAPRPQEPYRSPLRSMLRSSPQRWRGLRRAATLGMLFLVFGLCVHRFTFPFGVTSNEAMASTPSLLFNCSASPTLRGNECELPRASSFDTRPVQWIHVPKTGTSFANTVYRAACDELPTWAAISVVRSEQTVGGALKGKLVPYFETCFPTKTQSCRLHGGTELSYGHNHLSKSFAPQSVAYVTMLRDPIARLISGYHHDMHNCTPCTTEHSRTRPACCVKSGSTRTTLVEYTAIVAGIYTSYFGSGSVSSAASRIDQFSFVGLVEYWDLSICLYHYKFGGPRPSKAEFGNVRPGNYSGSADEAASLRRVLPEHAVANARMVEDYEIYSAGASKFWSDVRSAKRRRQLR